MDKLKIFGQSDLRGSINISGAKNAILPIMACSLLSNKILNLLNVPNLVDIKTMQILLESFGVEILKQKNSISLITKNVSNHVANYDLVRKMRASILVLGPLLSRFRNVKISLPGGCAIGLRPIDLHLFGLEQLGASFKVEDGYVVGNLKKNFRGTTIKLPLISVGATENIIMAAVLAEGKTTIVNAAKEPEIIDLSSCLNKMGAKIFGAGKTIIEIEGVTSLKEASHSIISDRIVAGTYLIAAIMLNKNFVIKNIQPEYLRIPIEILIEMGANLEVGIDFIEIKPSLSIKGTNIKTNPYPGFPTDLQAQMMALMSIANGESIIEESIFENRFLHVSELNRLGANIVVKKDIAYIAGNRKYRGAQVMASDLRASVSLVLAGLCAKGETTINRVYHLDRGYEKIEETLGKCGPKIIRIK